MASHRPADTLEQHQHEVCNAFARAAVAMRDAASTAENFSNWFSRVNNLQNIPMPPTFNGGSFNFVPNFGSPQQYSAPQPPAPEEAGKKRKAMDEPEGKRKRREKKPKDANAPKRPPSPYLLFQNEVRNTVKSQHPDLPYTQVLAEIAKLWKDMTPEQKAPYRASQAMLKAKYDQEKVDYETNPVNPTMADVPAAIKTPTAPPAVNNSAATVLPTTSDDSSESTGSSSSSDEEDEEEGEEEAVEPVPEPPRKKSKKEVTKAPTTPPVKVVKKKEKSTEGRKKKAADT